MGIDDFELPGGTPAISNLGNGCNGPLSVYTGTVATSDVTAGSTYAYTIRLLQSSGGSYYPCYLTIWLDHNQDGDFDDEGEELYRANSKGSRIMTGSITIPADAANGNTILRIRVSASNQGPITNPCGYWDFSETEDYSLNITGSSYEATQWIGTTTDWNTASNWSGGTVPTSFSHVFIPTSPSGGNFPIIPSSTNAACHSLNIREKASLELVGNLDVLD